MFDSRCRQQVSIDTKTMRLHNMIKSKRKCSLSGPGLHQNEVLSKWIHKFDILQQRNCFVLNFGTFKDIPLPQVSMTLETEITQNVDENNLNAPSNCFFVTVGGKYLDILDDVIRKVETVAKKMAAKPVMIVLETQNIHDVPTFSSDKSPPMVNPLLDSTKSYIYFDNENVVR